MKTVSVITPVFEGGKLLQATVNSVRKQEVPEDIHIEHILVSDDLNDYRAYQKSEPRYSCLVLSTGCRGSGPSAARNIGLSASSGEYVSFLDADDLWLPSRLNRLLPYADQYGAACDAISFIDMHDKRLYGEDTVIKRSGLMSHADVLGIDGAYFPLYQKSRIKHQWDEDLGFSEDFLFNYLAVCQTQGLYVCPDPLMAYRIRPGSISHTMPASGLKVDAAYQYLLENCPFVEVMSADEKALFMQRVSLKKELNHRYTRAWERDSSLTFEAFVGQLEVQEAIG